MPSPSSPPLFGVLVPVKPPAVAKSRLRGYGDPVRRALAAAFAADTVCAALDADLVGTVLAVTDDHALAADLRDLGAEVIPDGTAGDLNGSLVQAAAELLRRRPGLRIAVVCADLPALRHDELTRVLERAPSEGMGFLADADRHGTTVVTAVGIGDFAPRFGPGSRAAHLASGAVEIDCDDVDSVRRDVDTPADLTAAARLGTGRHTARVTDGPR